MNSVLKRALLFCLVAAMLGASCASTSTSKQNDSPVDKAGQGDETGKEAETRTYDPLDKLLSEYEKAAAPDRKIELLRKFAETPDPKMVPALTETLALDVDKHPIALHAFSCEILGEIAQTTPEALDEKAKKALVKGLFLANMKGQNVSRECGLAIQKLGQPAVPLLLETFRGENKQVSALLAEYNQPPRFAFPENHAKAVAAVRLSALRALEAAEPFLKELDETKQASEQLSAKHAVEWRVTEGQAASEIIRGLGEIGNEKAAELLAGVVKGEKIHKEWDDITDHYVELQLRQDAGYALVRMGARGHADVLLEMAENGVIADLEKLATIMEGRDRAMPVLDRYQFNWMMARAYTFLAGPDGLENLEKLIAGTKPPELKEKYRSFVPALREGGECLVKRTDLDKASCFGKLLGSDDKIVRHKAAYELGRLPAEAAGPVVARHLGHQDLSTRELLTYSAYDVPAEEMIDRIGWVLADEETQGSRYKHDHHRLKLLRAWLENNVARAAHK